MSGRVLGLHHVCDLNGQVVSDHHSTLLLCTGGLEGEDEEGGLRGWTAGAKPDEVLHPRVQDQMRCTRRNTHPGGTMTELFRTDAVHL